MSLDQSEKGILKAGGFSFIAAGFVLFLFFIALLVLQTSPTLTPEMILDDPVCMHALERQQRRNKIGEETSAMCSVQTPNEKHRTQSQASSEEVVREDKVTRQISDRENNNWFGYSRSKTGKQIEIQNRVVFKVRPKEVRSTNKGKVAIHTKS